MGILLGENWRGAKQLDDGSIQVAIQEDGGTIVLYVFPARGGPARRLGMLPYSEARYVFSSDGRHVTASVRESKFDVWVIKNLKDLLPRP